MNKIKRIPFTKDGYEKLKKEYTDLTSKRPDAVKVLQQARELGDLSENGMYKAARSTLSSIDHRLERLKMIIALADVEEKPSEGIVGLGSKVLLSDGDKQREFIIVGEMESDPLHNKISTISPLGKLLIGKRVEETVMVEAPAGNINYKIKKISNI